MRHLDCLHKLFKIGYMKSDGSIWIAFPYFHYPRGLASLVSLPPGSSYPSISLIEQGKVTSHLVKYMHHRSGLALFSQSGRIVSSVRKPSVPLSSAEGHIATIVVTGPEAFAKDTSGKPDSWKSWNEGLTEGIITYTPKSPPPSVKFVIRCYTKKRLRERVFGKSVGPKMTLVQPTGSKAGDGMLMAAPKGTPGSTSYLILQAYRIPRETKEPGSHLTLIGGFDLPEIIFDHTKPSSFLALSYPASNYEELQATLGSMDFVPMMEPERNVDEPLSFD